MRGLVGFAVGISFAGLVAIACGSPPAQKTQHQRYKVAPAKSGLKASQSSGSLFVQAATVISKPDGSQVITVSYSTGGDGLFFKTFTIDPDGRQVADDKNHVLMAPPPSALLKAHAAYLAQIEALLSDLASSGKAAP